MKLIISEDRVYPYDYGKKEVEGRMEFVSLEVERKKLDVASASLKMKDRYKKMLDGYGDYILESSDIESNRKLEYSFFINDKQWRKYKEYKMIFATKLKKEEDENEDPFKKLVDNYYEEDKVYNLDLLEEIISYMIKNKDTLDMNDKKILLRNSVDILSKYDDISDKYIYDEIMSMISEIIDKCNDTQKEIVMLYMKNYSINDIAKKLDVYEKTVYNNIKKILS